MFKKNVFLVICIATLSCTDNDSIPLPEDIKIQIIDYDINNVSVLLKGTEATSGLTGKWSIENDVDSGSFVDENNSLTTFNGSLFESYLIRWTITNGDLEKFDEKWINISDNFSLFELIQGGATIEELLSVGFSIEDLINAGISVQQLIQNEITIQDLIAAGVTVSQLVDNGVDGKELLDAEVPIIQIAEGGISSLELINLGVTEEELLSVNIIVKIPNTSLFILNYVYEKYEHEDAVNFCENLSIGSMTNWYLPSIQELRTIYDYRGQVLLEYSDEDYWSSTFSHYGTDENGTQANYDTKNMSDGFESTFYGFRKRIIPMIKL